MSNNIRIAALERAVNPDNAHCPGCTDWQKRDAVFEPIRDLEPGQQVQQERTVNCPECGKFLFVLRAITFDGEKKVSDA